MGSVLIVSNFLITSHPHTRSPENRNTNNRVTDYRRRHVVLINKENEYIVVVEGFLKLIFSVNLFTLKSHVCHSQVYIAALNFLFQASF